MPMTNDSGRQYPLTAIARFKFSDLVSGTYEPAIELPPDAIVTGGALVLETLFNSVTSDTITVGDVATGNRYKAGIDGKATAFTALVPTGYKYPSTKTVGITWTGVGTAPTQGAGYLLVEYIREGRSQENQG
jgi:hypothetical protein